MIKRKRTATRFRLPYTKDQVYTMLYAACKAEVMARMRRFVDSAEYKKHIFEVSNWLTSEESTFGLFLCGNKGNGKTTLIKGLKSLYAFIHSDEITTSHYHDLPRKGFEIISSKELIILAKAYHNPSKDNAENAMAYKRLKEIEILCIDDLGTEPRESMHYGEYITAVSDMIHHRYEQQYCTIATSNISPDELSQYYDERLADRFREMAKVVNFENEPSFRTIHVK